MSDVINVNFVQMNIYYFQFAKKKNVVKNLYIRMYAVPVNSDKKYIQSLLVIRNCADNLPENPESIGIFLCTELVSYFAFSTLRALQIGCIATVNVELQTTTI